jgi:hypothetical protein
VSEWYTDVAVGGEAGPALAVAAGARWNALGGAVFDALVGAGLAGNAPDWRFEIGLTWTLDFSDSPPREHTRELRYNRRHSAGSVFTRETQ